MSAFGVTSGHRLLPAGCLLYAREQRSPVRSATSEKRGDAVAQFLLGNQYANGKGVPQDYSEAMIWFQRAAEQGHPVAKLYLGVMYAEGRGVPQDYVRAHMWFSLSAAQGEQRAVKTLEMAERRMTPAQINEAQRLARDWKPDAQPTPR